ncbi:hypothetical protein K4G60_g1115 [Candida parapsilosis]|nr:hypothetical protein K4G60_g1115 [Candida parapsilosis]
MCYTSFSKVALIRSLDEKFVKWETAKNTQINNAGNKMQQSTGDKRLYVASGKEPPVDLEAQDYKKPKDHLLEIAQVTVNWKYGRLKTCEAALAYFVAITSLAVPSWAIYMGCIDELMDVYLSRFVGIILMLLSIVVSSLDLQYCMTMVVLRNLQQETNLNKHDICDIGLLTKCVSGAVFVMSPWPPIIPRRCVDYDDVERLLEVVFKEGTNIEIFFTPQFKGDSVIERISYRKIPNKVG